MVGAANMVCPDGLVIAVIAANKGAACGVYVCAVVWGAGVKTVPCGAAVFTGADAACIRPAPGIGRTAFRPCAIWVKKFFAADCMGMAAPDLSVPDCAGKDAESVCAAGFDKGVIGAVCFSPACGDIYFCRAGSMTSAASFSGAAGTSFTTCPGFNGGNAG